MRPPFGKWMRKPASRLRYSRGRLGEIAPEMRVEVDEARWLPLAEGPQLLAYGGERQMAEKALAFIREDGL